MYENKTTGFLFVLPFVIGVLGFKLFPHRSRALLAQITCNGTECLFGVFDIQTSDIRECHHLFFHGYILPWSTSHSQLLIEIPPDEKLAR